MAGAGVQTLAAKLMRTIHKDRDRLEHIDDYFHGNHALPYMPQNADQEYRELARRAISNWTPLLVDTPAQALYVDSFRRGSGEAEGGKAEWAHWQRSRLDARQLAIHRGALTYGHSFALTEKVKGKAITKGLSARRTAALYEDAANDDTPVAALTITRMPRIEGGETIRGRARMWDETYEYQLSFVSIEDTKSIIVSSGTRHNAGECPVTRFACAVDLDGRTMGVVEPMIPLQDRINQTVFDLLVAQSFASFKVRWATGMAPPLKRDEQGELVLDSDGHPIPLPVDVNAKRMFFGEDHETRFGTFDETPLDGFISSIDMSIRHLAAISQTPPHHLLGQIANLSAEALTAAETALSRKVEEFRNAFGESWERVFRLAAYLEGNAAAAEDFSAEVLWRDMESKSIAQAADALGKLAEQLGIPKRGLWARVPNVTKGELDHWESLLEEEDFDLAASNALNRQVQGGDPSLDDETALPEAA